MGAHWARRERTDKEDVRLFDMIIIKSPDQTFLFVLNAGFTLMYLCLGQI